VEVEMFKIFTHSFIAIVLSAMLAFGNFDKNDIHKEPDVEVVPREHVDR
jgi:hypothetical protein